MVLLSLTEQDKSKSKFSQMLHADVVDLISKLEAAIKKLESAMAKPLVAKDMKKLSSDLPGLDNSLDEAFAMANNFGYDLKGMVATKGKKRKGRS